MYFFYFYIFCSLVLGTYKIGPFSVRVYVTVAMLAYLIFMRFHNRTTYKMSRSIVMLFCLFIILQAIALLMNGEYDSFGYNKMILARFFNCIVTFFAIDYFVETPEKLRKTMYFFVGMMLFNCLVTILQYVGHPAGQAIALSLITSKETEEYILSGQNFDMSNFFGADPTIGIFEYTFINGNYIAIAGLILFGMFKTSSLSLWKYVSVTMLVVFLFACLATQSRTPFILFILFAVFLHMKEMIKRQENLVWLLLFFIVAYFSILWFAESFNFGRIFESERYEYDPRKEIWEHGIVFISDNFLYGGPMKFENLYGKAPHNYFLSAFIYGGLFGGIVASFIYLKVLYESVRMLVGKHIVQVSAVAAAVLIYNFGSLFHNASIINGDTMFFVTYCLMLKTRMMEPQKKTKITNNTKWKRNLLSLSPAHV